MRKIIATKAGGKKYQMNKVSENLTIGEIQKYCEKNSDGCCFEKVDCPFQMQFDTPIYKYECYFTYHNPCNWVSDNPGLGGKR